MDLPRSAQRRPGSPGRGVGAASPGRFRHALHSPQPRAGTCGLSKLLPQRVGRAMAARSKPRSEPLPARPSDRPTALAADVGRFRRGAAAPRAWPRRRATGWRLLEIGRSFSPHASVTMATSTSRKVNCSRPAARARRGSAASCAYQLVTSSEVLSLLFRRRHLRLKVALSVFAGSGKTGRRPQVTAPSWLPTPLQMRLGGPDPALRQFNAEWEAPCRLSSR